MLFDLNNSLILFILRITLSWNNFLLQIIDEYYSGNVSVTPCHHRGGRKILLDVVSRFSCSWTDITESASFGCKSTANEEFRVVRLVQQTERHRVVGVWKMISRKTTRLLNVLIDSSAIFLRSYVRCHSNDFSSIFFFNERCHFLITLYRPPLCVHLTRLIIVHRNHSGLRVWCTAQSRYLRHRKDNSHPCSILTYATVKCTYY